MLSSMERRPRTSDRATANLRRQIPSVGVPGWIVGCLLVAVSLVLSPRLARADETSTLRIGTLAPAESPWGQVFKVWAKGVSERTAGSLSLQFFWNGQQGDEGAMVGKIRTGQLDGAALTATGLAMIYKDVLVLQLPGLFRSWDKLDAARSAMQPGFDREFEKQGFKVLGWGDVGMAHVMTKGFEVHTPADLKHKGCFFLPGDPIAPVFYSVVGDVTPRQVGVTEILAGLTNHTINVVNAPALVAEQLQWAPRLDHVGLQVSGIGIGGLVFASAKLKGLPADAAAALVDTGRVASEALTLRIRREDAAAFERLKTRMTSYDHTPAEQAQWAKVFTETAVRLRGNSFDPAVFDAAVKYSQP
jgi:TRAP-type C4-dicarboxylate transport system substrate-binding protein